MTHRLCNLITSTADPLVIRRSAFLSVGLVDTSGGCPSEGRLKENEMWVKFCKTLWRQGLSVAALDWEANISAASKVRAAVELMGARTCSTLLTDDTLHVTYDRQNVFPLVTLMPCTCAGTFPMLGMETRVH